MIATRFISPAILALVLFPAGLSVWVPERANARVWQVERDGSGDFETIQDALDAASAGDTIRLGPGRYTESTPSQSGSQTLHYYGILNADDLTIEGVDRDLVFVGPESGSSPLGVGFSNSPGINTATIKGLTIERMFTGVAMALGALTLQDVSMRNLEQNGVGSRATAFLTVDGCRFEGIQSRGVLQVDVAGSPTVLVRHSEFRSSGMGIDSQVSSNVIEDCTFIDNTAAGVQFSFVASGTIQRCTFEANSTAVVVTTLSQASLFDNLISGGLVNLWIISDSIAIGSGNVLSGGSFATIYLTGEGTAALSDNHIFTLPGSYSARVNSGFGDGHEIDLRNNYWGTVDPVAIAASVLDSSDEEWITGTVLFEPFYGRPVSSKGTSFGRVKAAFGQDH